MSSVENSKEVERLDKKHTLPLPLPSQMPKPKKAKNDPNAFTKDPGFCIFSFDEFGTKDGSTKTTSKNLRTRL